MAAPSDTLTMALPANSRLRQFLVPHAGGTRVRVSLSNRLGTQALVLAQVRIGLAADDEGAALLPGSERTLQFDGAPMLTLEPGTSIRSDALEFPLQPFQRVAITLQLAAPVRELPRHYQALEQPYLALGDGENAFVPLALEQVESWYAISALDVQGGAASHTVVALGDSLTDGYTPALPCAGIAADPGSVGAQHRYPDFLAHRLANAGRTDLTVVNAGISGNRVNADGFSPQHGPSLPSRLQADVLDNPGVRTAILLEGINDLGLQAQPDAAALIAGLDRTVNSLQQAGVRVLLGTLTPARGFCTGPLAVLGDAATPGVLSGSAAVDAARLQVNDWIRTHSSADGVIDFDACIRDAGNPAFVNPAYDSGDHLHLNAAGYAAMAQCVNLDML